MSDYKDLESDQTQGAKVEKEDSSNEAGKIAMQGFAPLSDETRMALYDIQKLPPDQRGTAFGEYFQKAPQREYIQQNSSVDQYQTKIMDPATGEWIIVRDDRKQIEE